MRRVRSVLEVCEPGVALELPIHCRGQRAHHPGQGHPGVELLLVQPLDRFRSLGVLCRLGLSAEVVFAVGCAAGPLHGAVLGHEQILCAMQDT
jgi:hypothetical protein